MDMAGRYARRVGLWRLGVGDKIMKTRWVWKIVGLIVLAGVMWPPHVSAQDDPHEKNQIYWGGSIVNIGWAPDSLNLIYQDAAYDNVANRNINGPNTPNDDTWRQYSVITKQTTRSTFWPLQPDLTTEQIQDFEIYWVGDDLSFVFASPDGRYLVYSGQIQSEFSNRSPLGVADLVTGKHRLLTGEENLGWNTFQGIFEYYYIQWSEDSSAFTLSNRLQSSVHYVSHFDDLGKLEVKWLSPYGGMPLGTEQFLATDSYDISGDASKLILYGIYLNPAIRGYILVLWSISNDTGIVIPTNGETIGASFADDDQTILFVDEGGLKQYNIAANQTTLLDAEINSTWADYWAYFSPNGQYVAIRVAPPEPESLYLFEVPETGDTPDNAYEMGGGE